MCWINEQGFCPNDQSSTHKYETNTNFIYATYETVLNVSSESSTAVRV